MGEAVKFNVNVTTGVADRPATHQKMPLRDWQSKPDGTRPGDGPATPTAAQQAGDITFVRDSKAWTQWHAAPANDNRPKPIMVGLTGLRNVGKSTFADVLEQEFGFNRIHAYESGKEAACAFFRHALRFLPDAEERANRMVYGDLKDKPCEYLPGNAEPRYYMERTGHFHGTDMGVEWTLAMEVRAARMMHPMAPIVVESVVYESPWFRSQGGVVVRLTRPGFKGPVGVASDGAQAGLTVDYAYECSTVGAVEEAARQWAREVA